MIRDITLGQYFPGTSALHKADPRIKILMAILFIAATFAANGTLSFILLFLSALILFLVSRISVITVLKGLKPILFILIFTTFFQILFSRSGELLFEWHIIKIYDSGIIAAAKMIVRIVVLVVSTSVLLSYTTSPIVLTDGIEGLLKPLAKIKVPIHDFALIMSLALRFIPTLLEETEKIISAQKSRGADFSSGSLLKRARALIAIFIPLLASAIRHALDLSEAMICRGYRGGDGRTRLRQMKIRFSDIIWLTVSAAVLAAVIILNEYGIKDLIGLFGF